MVNLFISFKLTMITYYYYSNSVFITICIEDGCAESIKNFWDRIGNNLTLDFYPDPDGEPGTRCWMCGWKSSGTNNQFDLKTHIRGKKTSVEQAKGTPHRTQGR